MDIVIKTEDRKLEHLEDDLHDVKCDITSQTNNINFCQSVKEENLDEKYAINQQSSEFIHREMIGMFTTKLEDEKFPQLNEEVEIKEEITKNCSSKVDLTENRKLFVCGTCNKIFIRKGCLVRHLIVHTKERPYECRICHKKFGRAGTLKIHITTHTGQKPFECNICQRKFLRLGDVKVHTRTHTGEKPFDCEICGMKFPRVNSLRKHVRTHTGEKPFQCKICSRRFARSYRAKAHEKMHY